MSRRTDESRPSTVVKVRMPIEILHKCELIRKAGLHSDEAQTTFLGYLIKLGLAKYEKVILPSEISEDEVIPDIKLQKNEGMTQSVKTDKAQIVQHNSFSGEMVFKQD
jgi:hypothetical protein